MRCIKLVEMGCFKLSYSSETDIPVLRRGYNQGTFTPSPAGNTGLINTANNYGYDEIGNLIRDRQEEIDNISWTVYGKIKSITRESGSTKDDIIFNYDAQGNRISKTSMPHNNLLGVTTTYYIHDAGGNIMATYQLKTDDNGNVGFYLMEQNIFGSSRLGLIDRDLNLTTPTVTTPNIFTLTLGQKRYELSNHLGNVLSVVTDRKIPEESTTNPGTIDHYIADIKSAQDYYPGGMLMPGRSFNSSNYRFGFNGKEKDDEITGVTGSHTTAMFWEYDTRILRRWNLDPKPDPSISQYACFADNPIWFSDVLGDTVKLSTDFQKSKQWMDAYDKWSSSKAGKTFLKDYGINGKYEKISVTFNAINSPKGDEGTSARTEAFADNVGLTSQRAIDEMSGKGGDVSKMRSEIKTGENLRFNVNLYKTTNNNDIEDGLTIVHETQHIRLEHKDILENKKIWYSSSDQHYFMMQPKGQYYKERYGYLKEMNSLDKINVNGFVR